MFCEDHPPKMNSQFTLTLAVHSSKCATKWKTPWFPISLSLHLSPGYRHSKQLSVILVIRMALLCSNKLYTYNNA
jgi:hypothetical protein